MRKPKMAMITIIIAILFLLTSCTANSGENIVFGTFYNIKISGSSARSDLKKITALFHEIEKEVSTSIETSDVYKINNSPVGTPLTVGEHTKTLFLRSLELYHITEGAFNAAIFPLVELWNFSPDTFTGFAKSIPDAAAVNEYLAYSDINFFVFDDENNTITKLHEKAKLDFGGIAKGYAVDMAKTVAEKNKDALINVGGDIITFGSTKRIGLTHPRNTSNLFGIIRLTDNAIATSGDYERYYIFNGVRYNHIIATDGYPTGVHNNSIISAGVIGEESLVCDALSTAVMINGIEWAENTLPEMGYSCIIITEESYTIIGEIDFAARQTTHQKI